MIAATNRDLTVMVEEQRFRSDLFYRLSVFPVRIPALRERPEDIPLLVRDFTQQFAGRMNKRIESISSETMSVLCDHHWSGNIRELQNVIERAVILSSGPVLRVAVSDLRSSDCPTPSCASSAKATKQGNCKVFLKKPNASGSKTLWSKPTGSLQARRVPRLTWE